VKQGLYTVETGHKAFKFNKITGVRDTTYAEGLHFKIPYLEKAIIYNVKSQPTQIKSITGSHDLQQVEITLRVLYKPDDNKLQSIYR
jgi:prohibitin 2